MNSVSLNLKCDICIFPIFHISPHYHSISKNNFTCIQIKVAPFILFIYLVQQQLMTNKNDANDCIPKIKPPV